MKEDLPVTKLQKIVDILGGIARQGMDLGGVMAMVVEETLSLVDADGAAIELAEGADLIYRATSGIASQMLGLRIPIAASLSGRCFREGNSQYCRDSEADPRVDIEACRRIGLRSMVVIPLRHHEMVVGVLKAKSLRVDHFTEQDVLVMELLSTVVGATLHFAQMHSHDELTRRAMHDELTGLVNRSVFFERLRNQVGNCAASQQRLAVLMIDMNGLKKINDLYGHAAGDSALCELASRLRNAARSTDTVARIGGDEFAMLVYPIYGDNASLATARRIEAALHGEFIHKESAISLSASVGFSQYPHDGRTIDLLIETADGRMYESKRGENPLLGSNSMRGTS